MYVCFLTVFLLTRACELYWRTCPFLVAFRVELIVANEQQEDELLSVTECLGSKRVTVECHC